MSVEYERINWRDFPSTSTPVNAENMNKMDAAIAALVSETNSKEGDITEINSKIASLQSSKQDASTAINTSNIGSQRVSYASSAGSVEWANVQHKPSLGNGVTVRTVSLGTYYGPAAGGVVSVAVPSVSGYTPVMATMGDSYTGAQALPGIVPCWIEGNYVKFRIPIINQGDAFIASAQVLYAKN